jgi:hypothetical protein
MTKKMGYKRRARVVFLGGLHPAPANLAAHYAQKLGSEWLEARAAVLPGVQGEVPAMDDAMWAWADLLVTLDAVALASRPALRAGMQHRHYPFEPIPAVSDKTGWQDLAARVRSRVEGMIGGMRLMQKAADEFNVEEE